MKSLTRYGSFTERIATEKGMVKKIVKEEGGYKPHHRGGKGVSLITLMPNDKIIGVKPLEEDDGITLITARGKFIYFLECEIRPMGEIAKGVRGIRLEKGDKVVGMEIYPFYEK